MNIKGSVALVTGANGGIGSIFVQQLLESEAGKVYACARDVSKLNSLVSLEPHRVIPVELNIVNPESVAAAARQCSDVTILINNAGTSLNQGLIAAVNLDAARQEMELNYFGLLSMCRAFAPGLKQQGGGAIVNILSLLGKINLPFSGSYSASKAAAFSLTQGIRAELMAQGTLVIGVMPGTVNTELAKDWPDPKVEPTEVVKDTLQAVIDGQEDVYPGEQAQQISNQLLTDPKGVEKYLGNFLPGLSLAGL
ncbi:SDR family oxidoreductase [Thermosynechococcaceae cyanobacterium BACA0444]|uniref:SDR family oxidoreductase n=1 Tax=Pseudocalidococcus azoricus BACA0444 TaxID=2918990 RepID=A0AAE4FVH6_9CYAN|nr:SDR family oxidoreductase [Pseudocalidococcus azoricus]MDS3862312.1 SDR family oxidoreductase [Pseudocalidococcus azoricus BACA0444]